ncbi:Uncharacterized protein TCM_044539 [Theobroma cacao]|uniref:Uncharacterized protein n=1 Tax=Theobroma cacao TaxID=3641 RepID=A0A061FRY9_THECC|nr:Uncharacterized protein TCM_044539 [Theobroma cacao]
MLPPISASKGAPLFWGALDYCSIYLGSTCCGVVGRRMGAPRFPTNEYENNNDKNSGLDFGKNTCVDELDNEENIDNCLLSHGLLRLVE